MSTRRTTFQPSPPNENTLREAALRHLARYAATEARLLRVLDRRVERWLLAARKEAPEDDGLSESAAKAKQNARRVVAALVASGVVDDRAYAAGRARSLLRSGRSRAHIARHLATRGIAPPTVQAALPENPEREVAAALLLTRKRRLGAFAAGIAVSDPAAHRRALGILARAGFSHAVAREALASTIEDAEAAIERLRRS